MSSSNPLFVSSTWNLQSTDTGPGTTRPQEQFLKNYNITRADTTPEWHGYDAPDEVCTLPNHSDKFHPFHINKKIKIRSTIIVKPKKKDTQSNQIKAREMSNHRHTLYKKKSKKKINIDLKQKQTCTSLIIYKWQSFCHYYHYKIPPIFLSTKQKNKNSNPNWQNLFFFFEVSNQWEWKQ